MKTEAWLGLTIKHETQSWFGYKSARFVVLLNPLDY